MTKLPDSQEIDSLFELLVEQQKHTFPEPKKPLDAPTHHGVYIIYEGEDVLHVGRTIWSKGGLQQRLINHLRGKSSFARAYLSGEGNKLRDENYAFQYLEVLDPRKRAFLEALAIGKLYPQHIGVGVKE